MGSTFQFWRTSSVCLLAAAFFALAARNGALRADEGGNAIAPKLLIDFASPDAGKQVTPTKGVPVSMITVDKTGIAMSFPIQPAPHSGVHVTPATGKTWDLSAYGHIEAKVTNTGVKSLPFVMHVVDDTEDYWVETNTEFINVAPGETKVLTVYFGYQYGFEPSASFKSSNIKELYLFLFDTKDPQSFRIEELKVGGVPGEKPHFDPNTLSYKPKSGVILGQGVTFDLAKQVEANEAKVAAGMDGALVVDFAGGKEESLKIKPPIGMWDLTDANEIRVGVKNTGQIPVTPSIVVGPNKVPAKGPIAPGTEAEIIVPFIQGGSAAGGVFDSDKAKEFSLISDTTPRTKQLLITRIVADVAIDSDIPGWLGKKPPVDGDWTQTFDEEFDGPTIDYKKWNSLGSNRDAIHQGWNRNHNKNRETHFSKENTILKDGNVLLHFEKKTGKNNDSASGPETGYASGYLSTLGKWTQRYGYFEARLKLPKAPGLWTTFSLLPDRGKAVTPPANRFSALKLPIDTGSGGIEFDLVDHFSCWGIYRVNMALRANLIADKPAVNAKSGYIANNGYMRADKNGYVTTGLLWTPGVAVFYKNGREIYHWENTRIGDIQAYMKLVVAGGGNGNSLVDDDRLPDDFVIDYVRVWQRKDLATPGDGPKDNSGDPDETKN